MATSGTCSERPLEELLCYPCINNEKQWCLLLRLAAFAEGEVEKNRCFRSVQKCSEGVLGLGQSRLHTRSTTSLTPLGAQLGETSRA